MSHLRIAETFSSVQGEGHWVGVPSIFLRISGCNLRCVWCDTPYASWKPEGPIRPVEEIVAEIGQNLIRHVVVTGGEPMLFDAIEPLLEQLRAMGKILTIETAGTIFRQVPCDLMSISPKLAHSTPQNDRVWGERHERLRWNPAVLRQLCQSYSYQLKFVVNPDDGLHDLDEVQAALDEIGDVPPERVILMPEGTDSATLWRRASLLVEPCMVRGWRLSPRLHIDLFGNTRGT